jgi:hypothetical protein
MALSICPVAICHAPGERVWSLLEDPRSYSSWSDARVEALLPPGLAHLGQRVLMRAPARGRWFSVRFLIKRVDRAERVLELHADFPFGLALETRIAVTPIDATSCRVQYG